MTIASVIMEEAERVAKNRISTVDGHCVNYEQLYNREMQKEPWKEKRTNQLTVASVVNEHVERDGKNKMNTAHRHCLSYEHSR